MTALDLAPLVLAPIWLLVALALNRVPARLRHATAWTLALLGVPLLGALTYRYGPLAGVGALALGAATLALAARPQRGHPAE